MSHWAINAFVFLITAAAPVQIRTFLTGQHSDATSPQQIFHFHFNLDALGSLAKYFKAWNTK